MEEKVRAGGWVARSFLTVSPASTRHGRRVRVQELFDSDSACSANAHTFYMIPYSKIPLRHLFLAFYT